MTLQVLLGASLRRFYPEYDPALGLAVTVPPGTTVAQVIQQLGLPTAEVTIIMVNGRRQTPAFSLQGDERLALFPAVGGG